MDSVALAATIGGSVVALAGVTATAWSASLQRRSARELAKLQHEHERELARGQRLFDRRADAYEVMIGQVQVWWERIIDTQPIFREAGAPDPPEVPTPDEWRPMYVRLRAVGSRSVVDLYDDFAQTTRNFFIHARHLQAVLNRRGRTDEREPWEEVENARKQVKEVYDRIQSAVSDELATL
jgi:hypothetical protein